MIDNKICWKWVKTNLENLENYVILTPGKELTNLARCR